jgi:hypothetical protein
MAADLSVLSSSLRATLEPMLGDDEVVLGAWKGSTGSLVATSSRAIIAKRGVSMNWQINTFRWEDVRSIHVSRGTLKNPLANANSIVEITTAGVGNRDYATSSTLSFSNMAALMDAPNAIVFGWTPRQRRATDEAISVVERLAAAAKSG